MQGSSSSGGTNPFSSKTYPVIQCFRPYSLEYGISSFRHAKQHTRKDGVDIPLRTGYREGGNQGAVAAPHEGGEQIGSLDVCLVDSGALNRLCKSISVTRIINNDGSSLVVQGNSKQLVVGCMDAQCHILSLLFGPRALFCLKLVARASASASLSLSSDFAFLFEFGSILGCVKEGFFDSNNECYCTIVNRYGKSSYRESIGSSLVAQINNTQVVAACTCVYFLSPSSLWAPLALLWLELVARASGDCLLGSDAISRFSNSKSVSRVKIKDGTSRVMQSTSKQLVVGLLLQRLLLGPLLILQRVWGGCRRGFRDRLHK